MIATAAAGLALGGGLLWFGRRDLTHPAVAFGVPWFGAAALVQLRLTPLEQPWSTGFSLVVLGGGAAFVVAATLAGGTARARGAVAVGRERLSSGRLIAAAAALVAAGIVGAAYKARALDGIPLLSDQPDVVRGRALTQGALPAWSTALTNGFFLGMWCALAAVWVAPKGTSRARLAAVWLLAGLALFGVALEASRNLLVFAVGVPAIAAYLLARPRRLGDLGWIALAAGVLALGVGGLFAARFMRAESGGRQYLEQQLERQPAAVRPLLPIYLNAAYPFEAARRLHGAVPRPNPYGLGAISLASLPGAAFPEGKAPYGATVAGLMDGGRPDLLAWTVAGYQGRLLADLGWRGVLLGSALLGLMFGSLYRWARAKQGLVGVAAICYVTYYSAFMVYDNQLSFTLIGIFDLAVVALVVALATGRGWSRGSAGSRGGAPRRALPGRPRRWPRWGPGSTTRG